VPVLSLHGQAFLIVPAFGVAVLVAGLFFCLTVEVTDTNLHFYFGVGLIQRRISLADIEQCHETHTSLLSGWGIHRTLRGWLYNVSGFSAVEIILKNGNRFILGTDEPSKLCAVFKADKTKNFLHNYPPRFSSSA
jgi:hypothetical protein